MNVALRPRLLKQHRGWLPPLTVVLVACIPGAEQVDAWANFAAVGALVWVLLAYETVRFSALRNAIRRESRD